MYLRTTLELIGIAVALVAGAAMGARRVRREYALRLDAERRLREVEESKGLNVRAALRNASTVNGRIIRHALRQINDLQATKAALLDLLDSHGRAAALVESLDARDAHSYHSIHLADAIAQIEEDSRGAVTLLSPVPAVMVLGPSAPHLVGSLSALLIDLQGRTESPESVGIDIEFSGTHVVISLLAPNLAPALPDCCTLTAMTWLDSAEAVPDGWRVTLPAAPAKARASREPARREVYA